MESSNPVVSPLPLSKEASAGVTTVAFSLVAYRASGGMATEFLFTSKLLRLLLCVDSMSVFSLAKENEEGVQNKRTNGRVCEKT